MLVKLKYTNEDAPNYYRAASKMKSSVPFKEHESDFCYDCVAVSCEEVAKNVYKYELGIALQIDDEQLKFMDGDIILDIDARPRSSVWKTGMSLCNCEGTIDKDYTGTISAYFYHIMTDMPKYEVGDKVCQIKIGATVPIDFVVVDDLAKTNRGEGGFGSTGR